MSFLSITLLVIALKSDTFSQATSPRAILQGMWRGKNIEYVDGAVCVKIRSGADRLAVAAHIQSQGGQIWEDFDRLGWGLISLPVGAHVFAVLDGIRQSPLIEDAEPEMVGHIFFDPNDPYYAGTSPATYHYQWYLYN
jgi:hypothetical protein